MVIFSSVIWSLAFLYQSNLVVSDMIIDPLFLTAYRLQFYAVVLPYVNREYQRKNNPHSGIRKLNINDPDLKSNLSNKVILITGGSRGIGVEIVRVFLRKDAHVITTSSSNDPKVIEARYNKIIEEVPQGKWKLEIWHLDLMSMKSIIDFVEKFESQNNTQLNYFIGNAGVMFPKFQLSEDGFESQFSINYLGHVLLSYHLMPHLYETAKKCNEPSRLILVSSCLHHIPTRIRFQDLQSLQVYSPHYAYGLSKISVLYFVYKLSRTLKMKSDWNRHVKVFSLHPGLVDTKLLSNIDIMGNPFVASQITLREPKAGAETVIYATLSNELNDKTGEYLEDNKISHSSALSYNEENQNKMWTLTAQLLSKWTNGSWFEDL